MARFRLVYKSRYSFVYAKTGKRFVTNAEIRWCRTPNYKGIQVTWYQADVNKDGFNNAVGLRRQDLLRLPFMILHYRLYRLFHRR